MWKCDCELWVRDPKGVVRCDGSGVHMTENPIDFIPAITDERLAMNTKDNNNNNNNNNNNSNNNNDSNKSNKRRRGRGGGSSGSGKNSNPSSSTKLSHALSWALRHAAPDLGLTMTPGGWVPVQQIIESKHPRLRGTTLEAIEDVVKNNDKQRYALSMRPQTEFGDVIPTTGSSSSTSESQLALHPISNPESKIDDDDDDHRILCIRANQGHSIKTIDPTLLLTKLTSDQVKNLPCIVHGTNKEAWNSIAQEGLSKMNRTHIHFATGLPEDGGVISGMRKTASVYIFVDPESCLQDGIEFFISANGVVLTDGFHGILPTKYFRTVQGSNGEVLMKNQES